jgi:hypothetical protein
MSLRAAMLVTLGRAECDNPPRDNPHCGIGRAVLVADNPHTATNTALGVLVLVKGKAMSLRAAIAG